VKSLEAEVDRLQAEKSTLAAEVAELKVSCLSELANVWVNLRQVLTGNDTVQAKSTKLQDLVTAMAPEADFELEGEQSGLE
jgi:hypothetical protein